jgi:hypothetical protein
MNDEYNKKEKSECVRSLNKRTIATIAAAAAATTTIDDEDR